VAVEDQDTALEMIKSCEDYLGSELTTAGEATSEFLQSIDVNPGKFLVLWEIQQ
jgi:hypothetical protein